MNPVPSEIDKELRESINSFYERAKNLIDGSGSMPKKQSYEEFSDLVKNFSEGLGDLELQYMVKELSTEDEKLETYYSDNQLYICLVKGVIEDCLLGGVKIDLMPGFGDIPSRFVDSWDPSQDLKKSLENFNKGVSDGNLKANLSVKGRDLVKSECYGGNQNNPVTHNYKPFKGNGGRDICLN